MRLYTFIIVVLLSIFIILFGVWSLMNRKSVYLSKTPTPSIQQNVITPRTYATPVIIDKTIFPTLFPEDFSQNAAVVDHIEKQTKKERPDVYLSNILPYTQDGFMASAILVDDTTPAHFRIYVEITDSQTEEQSKKAFIQWLKSQGIDDSKLSTLDIHYNIME